MKLADLTYLNRGVPSDIPSIEDFGLKGLPITDNTTDQSTAFFAALQAAYNAGIFAISIPDNRRINIVTGGTNPGVSIYTKTGEIHNIAALGVGGRIQHSARRGVVYSGIRFVCDNTPKGAANSGTETSICLRFENGDSNKVLNCSFDNYYGVCALFRHEGAPIVSGSTATRCFKDSFHFTGNTDGPLIISTVVTNGGDDGIAFVSYETGNEGGRGLVTNGRIIGCTVNGVKFARGIAIVGGNNILISECIINGKIPDIYAEDATRFARGGLLICGERVEESGVELYRTFPATNITVRDTRVLNAGNAVGSHQYGAVSILNYASNPNPCRNILLDGLLVDGSPAVLLNIHGGAADKIEGVRIRNSSIARNNDPLGVNGTPGAGVRAGLEIAFTRNIDVELTVSESAGSGMFISRTCTGTFRGEFRTFNICSSTTNGPRRIFNGDPNPQFSSIDLRVIPVAQPYASGTVAYAIDRSILWQGCLGKAKRIELVTSLPQIAGIGLPKTGDLWSDNINQAVTWLGNAWTNTQPNPVSFTVSKVAALTVSKGLALLGTLPTYISGTNLVHTFTVNPGETVQVDDSTGLTAMWKPTSF